MNVSIIDLVFCSLFCIGLHGVTRKVEFLQRLAYMENKELRSALFEPIFECLTCMSSLWGTLYFTYISCPYGLFLECLKLTFAGVAILTVASMIIRIKPLLMACYFTILALFLIDMPYLLEPYLLFLFALAGLNYIVDNFLLLVKNSKFRV